MQICIIILHLQNAAANMRKKSAPNFKPGKKTSEKSERQPTLWERISKHTDTVNRDLFMARCIEAVEIGYQGLKSKMHRIAPSRFPADELEAMAAATGTTVEQLKDSSLYLYCPQRHTYVFTTEAARMPAESHEA